MEEIEGVLSEIIYQNEVNGYTVGVIETEDEQITVVGYLPFIKKGDTLKITGKFVEHKDYGEQFKIETFEKLMPQTLSALEKYLANGNIKGIGPATATKIIEKFGEETIHVLKFEPEKLAQIKGISKDKAVEISESFVENWEVWQIVGFLERFGIGAENAKKVYDMLGANAIAEIEADPYILIDISRGVDFKQIDQMAIKLGIERENQKRVKSGIKYALIKITYNGHCCTLESNLIEYVKTLLNVNEAVIQDGIVNLKVNNEIVVENRNDEKWVYLYSFYKAENQIAERILKLDKAKNMKKVSNIEKELKLVEEKTDIMLSEKQKEAIRAINDNNVTIITGGPGTGKTTIINLILRLYKPKKGKILLDNIDINNIDKKSYLKEISILNQETYLFNLSIRENFNLINNSIKRQEEICKFTGVSNFIEGLPNGYDTIIDENSNNLSGGQKRLLSLTRMLLKESKILILDEATSSLDKEKVEKFSKILEKLKENHTIIVITHKKEIIDIADETIVINKGKVKIKI